MFLTRELAKLLLLIIFNSIILLITGDHKDIISSVWWPTVSTRYPKYHEYSILLKDMAVKFPNIVTYYSAGKSVEGRNMWVVHLAENATQPRPLLRPMLKQVSSMHGDEVVGRALLLMLAVDIIKRYTENDERVVKLLKNADIHLMPSVNPDGFEAAIKDCAPDPEIVGRQNKNGVDLNRNFPDQFVTRRPSHPDFYKDREPETLNMMAYIKNHPFVLSSNLHAGALVASYPFDSVPLNIDKDPKYNQTGIPSLAPDDKIFKQLALEYSMNHKTMYSQTYDRIGECTEGEDNFTNGVTNGAEWYNVRGGMQDFNYVHTNCFEITIELSCCKYPPDEVLIKEWEQNKESLYNFMESVHWGVKGLVNDESGKPIKGVKIIIKDIKKFVLSTSKGEYWRLLLPGTYQIKAERKGYQPADFKDIVIKKGETARLDFTLKRK